MTSGLPAASRTTKGALTVSGSGPAAGARKAISKAPQIDARATPLVRLPRRRPAASSRSALASRRSSSSSR